MATPRKLPPIWLMGFGFFPLGVFGSLMLITVPQLLAANHVAEPKIAAITAFGLTPGFLSFALMPLLDWRFSRRTYAVLFAVIGAGCLFGAFAFITNLQLLAWLLFAGNFSISLCVAAVGGWFGSVTPASDDARLGAWFTAFNIGAGGVVLMVAPALVRGLPPGVGAALLSLMILAPLPLYFAVDCAPADGRLASESFIAFARDVALLLRRPMVLWSILLFIAPAASFALTNTLGGYGRDFHTPEALVGWIAGIGVAIAGVFGSLVVPLISRRVAPRSLYLLIGGFGAAFTLVLMLAPHTPLVFGLAMLGENVFQAASFSTQNQITLRTIGQNNPLAATQFGMLTAVSIVPLTYMQLIDGNAYTVGAVGGSLLADALISGGACLLLGVVLWMFRRAVPPLPLLAARDQDAEMLDAAA